MQYNSHATGQDCVSEVLKICDTTIDVYSINDITRRFNNALDRYFEIAFRADGRWPADDKNNLDANPPFEAQSLVSGTNQYRFNGYSNEILTLFRLDVLDSTGAPQNITEEAFEDLERPFSELYDTTDTGVPTHYIKMGDFFYVRPTPSYSIANGLKVFFSRPALRMATTDTTKEPGVPTIHHPYLCRVAAEPFLIEKKLPQLPAIMAQIQRDEREIGNYYGSRGADKRSGLRPIMENNR